MGLWSTDSVQPKWKLGEAFSHDHAYFCILLNFCYYPTSYQICDHRLYSISSTYRNQNFNWIERVLNYSRRLIEDRCLLKITQKIEYQGLSLLSIWLKRYRHYYFQTQRKEFLSRWEPAKDLFKEENGA